MKHFIWPCIALLSASCMTLSRMDTDGDGRVSRREAEKSAELAAAFGIGDANDDGYLDAEEFESAKDWLASQGNRGEPAPGGHRH